MYDTCQILPSSTKTYAGMELHNVVANLDFTGDGTTNAITYNKLVFGGLSNGLLAYNCALNIGNCTFNNIQRLPAYDAYDNSSGSDNGSGIYFLSIQEKNFKRSNKRITI